MFISGQLPIDPETGKIEKKFKDQCKQSLLNIQSILVNEGLTLNDIVKLTVIVKYLSEFDQVNEVFIEIFERSYPTRSTFEVGRLQKKLRLKLKQLQ